MKRIESKTCIRFKRIYPEPGKKWIVIMREASATTCYDRYINETLKDRRVGNLGKVRSFYHLMRKLIITTIRFLTEDGTLDAFMEPIRPGLVLVARHSWWRLRFLLMTMRVQSASLSMSSYTI